MPTGDTRVDPIRLSLSIVPQNIPLIKILPRIILMTQLGKRLSIKIGQEESEALNHLWGRLGVLLQRGNAAILGNRVPTFPGPTIDGTH